jgi:hypothetical protein
MPHQLWVNYHHTARLQGATPKVMAMGGLGNKHIGDVVGWATIVKRWGLGGRAACVVCAACAACASYVRHRPASEGVVLY